MRYRDITYPISDQITPWPGQPPMRRSAAADMCGGDVANVSVIDLSVHTGTHMDAPLHFIEGDLDITHFPLELSLGQVRVALVVDQAGDITKADLEAYEARTSPLAVGDRLMIRTRNSADDWHTQPFRENYCAVSPAAAQHLVDRGVALLGVDYLSVAPFDDPVTTHLILLTKRVWIVEGLDLREVEEGTYNYQCLPLPIKGSDASPCRVLLADQA